MLLHSELTVHEYVVVGLKSAMPLLLSEHFHRAYTVMNIYIDLSRNLYTCFSPHTSLCSIENTTIAHKKAHRGNPAMRTLRSFSPPSCPDHLNGPAGARVELMEPIRGIRLSGAESW